MGTVQDVLRVAAAELGITESPAGSNHQKFSAELGRPAEPWCADFVVWVMRHAGVNLPNESAFTPTMLNGFFASKAGLRGSKGIASGDVCFFNFSGGSQPEHVGIVVAVNQDGSLITIEGNTSAGDSGSQANGGGVFRRIRSARFVIGYGRPAYSKEIAPMYQPFSIAGQVVASLNAPDGGAWVLTDVGAIYSFGCRDFDAPSRHPEYWNLPGQKAAQLEAFNGGYTVVDNFGHKYNYPAV